MNIQIKKSDKTYKSKLTEASLHYSVSCKPCHGAEGEGLGVFPALNPNEFVQGNLNADLVEFVLEGRVGTAMAGFNGRLTEDEIANVVSFLRLWQP